MKNLFVLLTVSLFLTSCMDGYRPSNNGEYEAVNGLGIVHRVFQADGRTIGQKSVLLEDGKIFKRSINIYNDTPDGFFFLKAGDTVRYENKKIVEIRFKD